MKKSTATALIVAAVLIVAGVLIIVFTSLSLTGRVNKKIAQDDFYTISGDNIQQLTAVVDLSDIQIGESDNDQIEVIYRTDELERYDISVSDDGVLLIEGSSTDDFWNNYVYRIINLGDKKLQIKLPSEWSGTLDITSFAGDLELNSLNTLSALNCKTTSGSLGAFDITAANDLTFSSVSGAIKVNNCFSKLLNVETVSGDISLNAAKTAEVRMHSVSGDMNFLNLDADNINCNNMTGSVAGSLSGSIDDYKISAKSINGNNELSSGGLGQRTLFVETISGNINITFEE